MVRSVAMHAKKLALVSYATKCIEQVLSGEVVKSHAEAEERGEPFVGTANAQPIAYD